MIHKNASIFWKRAGNFACVAAREMVMWPFSSGSRKASNALRLTSANSSKNNTPLCASEISPGRGGVPPPTNATEVAVWCGLRVCRCIHWFNSNRPARLAMAALSSASSSVMSGSKAAKRCASIDLPVPGGPTNKRECPPAAAISRARRDGRRMKG
jgi:hypothetical protein